MDDSVAYGEFKGWAYEMSDTEPTAAEKDGYFKDPATKAETEELLITGNITLYAIWSKSYTVTFKKTGDTTVPDQVIPAGGYVTPPEQPAKEGTVFEAWVDASGNVWDFEKNTVTENTTLYAKWTGGTEPSGGAMEDFYIGDIDDVSDSCVFDPVNHGQSSFIYFTYKEQPVSNGSGKGIIITGVKNSPEHLVIPEQLPSLSLGDDSMLDVVDVDNNAFKNCTSLKSVHFLADDTNQYDTDNWFTGCTNLEYVEMPLLENGVIGSCTFNGCSNLKCVKFREGTKLTNNNSFNGWSGKTRVTIPDGITEIASRTFYGFTGLTNVTIPDGVTSIGDYAFSGCNSLTEITVPDSVTSIGIGAFNGCNSIKSIVLPFVGSSRSASDGISRYFCYIFSRDSSSWGSSYVPSSLKTVKLTDTTRIPADAFYNCSNLTKIILPEGLTSIGSYAFEKCTGLTDLDYYCTDTLPTDTAFDNCSNLTIHIPEANDSLQAFLDSKGISTVK